MGALRDREGSFTFLFTDIVGSTERWEEEPDRMGDALATSEQLQTDHIERHGGRVFKNTGDGLAARFDVPADAAAAAAAIQLDTRRREWQDGGLAVRVGINTGRAEQRASDYFGSAVNLAARTMAIARDGQSLLTESAADIARDSLDPDLTLRDLGPVWLKGFQHPHRLFQLDHVESAVDFPPLPSRAFAERLPPSSGSSFVERPGEIARLLTAVKERRVVTLVGPTGVGKSRLAIEIGRRAADRFEDGVRWINLSDVTTGERVLPAVAAELDLVASSEEPVVDVAEHLRDRELLLLLDNCEHVVTAVQRLVNELLARCPSVVTLATSQAPLHVAGEIVHVVEPLTVAASGGDVSAAVALFVDRVRSTGAPFDLTDDDRATLETLCSRLDGLPLAIELAAARCRAMSVSELARRLDERFAVLKSPRSRALGASDRQHHGTLYEAVGWSYGLLLPDEQVVFDAMSVFRGDNELAAIESVVTSLGLVDDDPVDLLWELVDKSLVRIDTTGATTRYTMLLCVRDFAAERLAERGVARRAGDAHAAYFLQFAEQAERGRGGPDERRWVEAQLADLANLRAAAAHAAETGDLDTAIRLYVALYEVAALQGRVEVFDWFDPTAHVESGHELEPAALAMAGLRHDPLRPASLATAEQALDLFRARGGRPHRILPFARGFAHFSRGDPQAAVAAYAEAVDVIRDTEGPNGRWINARALVAMRSGDVDRARTLVDEARQIGQPSGVAAALNALARSLGPHQPDEAIRVAIEAADLADSVYNRHAGVYVDLTVARILARGEAPDAAFTYLLHALETAAELRQHEAMWNALDELTAILRRSDRHADADALIGPWRQRYPSRAAGHMAGPRGAVDRETDASLDELVAHTRRVLDGFGLG